MKLAKRVIGLLIVLSLTTGMNLISFAGTKQSQNQIDTTAEVNAKNLNPRGPATPVTSVKVVSHKINSTTNHLMVTVDVIGYGTDNCTFDGVRVYADKIDSIYEGFTQVGLSYTFDCGVKPGPGTYLFKALYTSWNSPYNTSLGFKYITIE